MKLLNTIWKFIVSLLVRFATWIGLYLLSLFLSSPILCMIQFIYGLVTGTLPEAFITSFWSVWLIASIPFAVILICLVEYKAWVISHESIEKKDKDKK